MASFLSGLVLCIALVSGQNIQPSNASLPTSERTFTQLTTLGSDTLVFNIAPLTSEVGMGQSSAAVAVRIPLLHYTLFLAYNG
jgi:hypothetical protein